jgi:hypothetical protein
MPSTQAVGVEVLIQSQHYHLKTTIVWAARVGQQFCESGVLSCVLVLILNILLLVILDTLL